MRKNLYFDLEIELMFPTNVHWRLRYNMASKYYITLDFTGLHVENLGSIYFRTRSLLDVYSSYRDALFLGSQLIHSQ